MGHTDYDRLGGDYAQGRRTDPRWMSAIRDVLGAATSVANVAVLALLTVHHWTDPSAGLRELQRVAKRQVILTFLPDGHARFWLVEDAGASRLRRRGPGSPLGETGRLPLPGRACQHLQPCHLRRTHPS